MYFTHHTQSYLVVVSTLVALGHTKHYAYDKLAEAHDTGHAVCGHGYIYYKTGYGYSFVPALDVSL